MVKVAEEAPAATWTEAGTIRAVGKLLASETLALLDAACERVTVQVVEVAGARVVAAHCTEEMEVGDAVRERLLLALFPFQLAVIDADWSVLNEPAVALKVAVAALGAIETVEGTEMLPAEVKVTVPPAASGALIVTVQDATAPAVRELGLQDNPLSTGNVALAPVTAPPVVFNAIWLPSRLAPSPSETPIATEVAPLARVTATVATLPLAIKLAFRPVAIQM